MKIKLFTDATVSTVPDHRPVYITGNFNNWNEKDERFKMTKANGYFEYTVDNTDILPNVIEYKYTRGSWQDEELDIYGAKTQNRIAYKNQGDITDFVPRWAKHGKSFESKYLPKIEIVHTHFEIPQLDKTRQVRVLLPYNYHEATRHYPVLYLQDGQNLFDKHAPFGNWALDERLAVLAELGFGDVIIVAIDHGEVERINEYSPKENIKLGIGQNEGTKYLQFMCDTLKPHIDEQYRTLPEREYTGVGGSSMGGLISLYAGIQHADVFGKIMVFSPSLWIYPKVYEEVLEKGALANTKLYLYAGGRESQTMLPNMHRLQHQIYKNEEKVEMNLVIDPNGTHTETQWSSEFPEAVEWLFY